jgi:hypothetical protein
MLILLERLIGSVDFRGEVIGDNLFQIALIAIIQIIFSLNF